MRSLQGLGQIVPTAQWCLIGGLMVEILLISSGEMMLRLTDDVDIVGDVGADRAVLRNLPSLMSHTGKLPGVSVPQYRTVTQSRSHYQRAL